MMLLIDMLDQHISKHKDYANKFDTGAMVAKNFAMSLLDKEQDQIIEAYETAMETDIYNEPLKIGKDYYEQTFKSE